MPIIAKIQVISAHELAEQLRNKGVNLSEWTGIQKTSGDLSKLIIATSAAEVGLDLELYEVHTQFWGFDWEIPSLIQRIGRVWRLKSEHPFKVFIHLDGTLVPSLIKNIFEENETLSKDQFTELLYDTYGGQQSFDQKEYVSYYLWDEEEKQKLKFIWQIIDSKISFYFRPPQSQAVFERNGHKFVYNQLSIENQYHIKLERRVTDMPFWKSFGLPEYKVLSKKSQDERSWNKPYAGKLHPIHNSKKWFIYQPEESNII